MDEIVAAYRTRGLKPQEALSAIVLLLAAGTETTRCAIANLFHFIAEQPDSWAQALGDRSAIRPFVEESLRVGVPLGRTVRFARRDIRIEDGGPIAAARGSVVDLRLDEANADEGAIRCPHAWRPETGRGVGLAFGSGPHACIGKGLAMAELLEVAELLAEERLQAAAIGTRTAIQGATFRRPATLQVTL
jgi:cytochrome P450